jgi:uncharacterized integral membrane protein
LSGGGGTNQRRRRRVALLQSPGVNEVPGIEQRGTNWRQWAIGFAVALLVIFVLVNTEEVKVDFLIGETTMPLIIALLISAALGAVIGYIGPIVRRHRRAERRRD